MTASKRNSVLVLSFLGLALLLVCLVGCGGQAGLQGSTGDESISPRFTDDRTSHSTQANFTEASDEEEDSDSSAETAEEDQGDSAAAADRIAAIRRQNNTPEPDFGDTDDTEYPPEQDLLWQAFNQADEYYSMGVIANRESSWEEAEYYFEKALKILASLDVQTDSALTPEAVKYNTLLDNIVADYRVTLRSLGRLDEDAAPSAIVERFGDLEAKLGPDSMHVYKSESGGASYDLPVVLNNRVRSSIVYFQTVANQAFRRYLSRSEKYAPLFRRTLKQYGLPEDLIYLSLVESGYNPHAYSWARAMGLWQFIAETGRLYGLQRTWWIDERKDPVKATDAAARFLKELYDKFGSWELAMAAYNGGPGRVERETARQHTTDFWKLKLRQQTMDYVPLIYAAIIIAKEPEKYGFNDIQYEPELKWDEITINRCLGLNSIAESVGCSVDDLRLLNPELLRAFTPPNEKEYVLKIPAGTKEKFLAAYESMPTPKEATWAKHRVKRKETLASIANRYGLSQNAILDANNLSRGTKLRSGMEIIIPVSGRSDSDAGSTASKREYKSSKGTYTVRSGDTMWDIAKAFGVTADELRRVNYLGADARIHIGQKLRIPSYATKLADVDGSSDIPSADLSADVPTASGSSQGKTVKTGGTVLYTVKSGDTIWDIARKFNTTTDQIRILSGLGKTSRIHIGQQLVVGTGVNGGSSNGQVVMYEIRDGDTLARIAQRYRTTIAKILSDNPTADPYQLRIGDKIKISSN